MDTTKGTIDGTIDGTKDGTIGGMIESIRGMIDTRMIGQGEVGLVGQELEKG
jgi:hypothetical protein